MFLYITLIVNILLLNNDNEIVKIANNIQKKYNTYNKEYVVIIDYSKSIKDERLFLVDIKKQKVILKSTVSHGVNSGKTYAINFSNVENTKKSSLGVYQTMDTYYGHYGYSMKLKGLDSSNSNAQKRFIIFHSNKKMKTQWSWGCFATPEDINKKIINIVKNGCLVYVKR